MLDNERLHLVIRRWSLLGIWLPLVFAPRVLAYECVNEGLFRFHVGIILPLFGPLVRYRGWLALITKPDDGADSFDR
jgi:Domain of unknown function (DUF4166)